jgi:ubiquinol-cytochrome c reductase iron-sulfur subunit
MRIACFLALVVLGALGAAVAAATGAPPALFAGALAVTFAAFGAACGAAAVALHAADDLREPRKPHGPTVAARALADEVGRPVFGRMWFAAFAALAGLGLVPLIALARKPGRRVPTGWSPGVTLVDEYNAPVHRDRLETGGIATVFPRDGVALPDAAVALIRVPLDAIAGTPSSIGATPDGYVAFSKICTHAGCPVALYRRQSHELYCPCHQSRFDVLRGAANVSGPAPRPLPQLPLNVDANGFLIATGDFDAPVGPDDWDRLP